jgi:hypothetical protein
MSQPFVAGAYLLVKPHPELGPGHLTASACLAEMAPDDWALDWVSTEPERREQHVARLGIRPGELPAVMRWATDHFGGRFRWPNVFTDLEIARAFRARFVPADIHLLGIGLPVDLVDSFMSMAAPPPPQPGYAPVGATGVYQVLTARRPLEGGGATRGFEVLGYDEAGKFCSYRCNALGADFERQFGARFNARGLLDEETTARRCAEYASRPEVFTCSRFWHPWLVQEYPS